MLKNAVFILSGNAFTSLMSLIRNLIIARLISVEDYGIAATFAISMAIVEMMSTLGLQQLIIQDRDGNKPELQTGLQGFHFARSLIAALALFFLAPWIADFLGIPEISWAYQVLAIVPFLNGLMHFDIFRKQREMSYKPYIVTMSMSITLSVAFVFPLYWWFGDYRVMLFAVILQAFALLVLSHIMSERKYQMSMTRDVVFKSVNFGWPLLINNIFLFIVFQGERIIVGRELGMASLAVFSMGLTLTLTPTLVVAKSIQSFFLPQLTKARDEDADTFQSLAFATMQSTLANGVLLACFIYLCGDLLVDLLLGPQYAPLKLLIIWFAILNAIRVFKVGCSIVALSHARTSNAMVSNLFRVLSMPISWYAAIATGDPLIILWIASGAEICGYLAALILVRNRVHLPLNKMRVPIMASAASMALIAGFTWAAFKGNSPFQWPEFSSLIVLVFTALALVSMRDLQKYVHTKFIAK